VQPRALCARLHAAPVLVEGAGARGFHTNHCSHTPWPCAPEFVSAALTAPPDLRSTTRSHLAAAASAANGRASCSLDSRPTIAVGASHRVELRSRRKACHSSPSFRSQAKASSSHSSPLRFESAREDSDRRGRELEQDGIAWIVFSASSSKRGKSCFSNSTPIAEAGALGRLPHTGRRRIPCSEKAWNSGTASPLALERQTCVGSVRGIRTEAANCNSNAHTLLNCVESARRPGLLACSLAAPLVAWR
jgi:hypothetical protein